MNNTYQEGYNISMGFGYHALFHSMKLNMLNNFTFTPVFSYDTQDECSSIVQREHFRDFKGMCTIEALECSGMINIDSYDCLISEFKFYLGSRKPFVGCFGLSHGIEREEYSLIHQLKRKNQINENAFTAGISKSLVVATNNTYRVRSSHYAETDYSSSFTGSLTLN